MDIQVVPQPTFVAVKVSGDLELGTIKTLRGNLQKILSKQKRSLHLDLADVGYMDSSGAAVLVEGIKWSRKYGVDFRIVEVSEAVHNSLELMHLLEFFGLKGT